METKTISIQVLTPSEGMYLTPKNRNENSEPIMSLKVINPQEEYIEIPIDEGERIVNDWYAREHQVFNIN